MPLSGLVQPVGVLSSRTAVCEANGHIVIVADDSVSGTAVIL